MTDLKDDETDFDRWIWELDEDVIQGEFGYEPGEFTVYTSHWRQLYDEGWTPAQAWQRALDGHRNARLEEDARKMRRCSRGFVRTASNDPLHPRLPPQSCR